MSIWLAASGGLSWWMEATLNVARRGQTNVHPAAAFCWKQVVLGLTLLVLALTVMTGGGLQESLIWQNRTSLRDAAWRIGDVVLQESRGEYQAPAPELNLDEHGIIRPDPETEDEYDDDGELIVPSAFDQMMRRVVKPFDTSKTLTDHSPPHCIVYGFGEPALLLISTAYDGRSCSGRSVFRSRMEGRPTAAFLCLAER
ncbi:MAG: hypothetical protein R3C49_06445 [Planctomycetaceae bacterium]